MNPATLEALLDGLPRQTVAVLGDFCLDRYMVIDPGIVERSLETGLPVKGVTAVRNSPGGAGAVSANLAALGVGRVIPVGLVGGDGEGFELLRLLGRMGLDLGCLRQSDSRLTPTYLKPVVAEPGGGERELGRLDIRSREALGAGEERVLLADLAAAAEGAGALVVSDYLEAGVVTPVMRQAVADLARRWPAKPVLVDSRHHLGGFPGCSLKPNAREFAELVGRGEKVSGTFCAQHPEGPSRQKVPDTFSPLEELAGQARAAAARAGRPIFITLGARGVLAAAAGQSWHLPAFPQRGPIDPVGAGDSVLAALAAALAAGAAVPDAALLAVLVASLTVEQLGTTGTAGPASVRRRFAQYAREFPELAGP